MTPVPRGPGARRALVALAVAAALVTACDGNAPLPSGASPAPSGDATASGEMTPQATAAPSAGETSPTPSGSPGEIPTAPPGASPGASTKPGGAGACSGSDDNRAFYASLARAVAWDVYCPVLPAGWFVDTGEFRQANGGRLEISYKGPAGARLEIREGAYCPEPAGCLPAGREAGPATFGDRIGLLLDPGDGTWVVLAEDAGVAWEARGRGMDGAALAAFTAAFARVEE